MKFREDIEELFLKQIISIYHMNKYGGKEMRSFAKSTRYDWLVNYIPEPIKKTLGNAKDKIMSLFKTNTTEDCIKPTHVSNVYRGEKKPSKPKIKTIRKQQNCRCKKSFQTKKRKIIRDLKIFLNKKKNVIPNQLRVGNFYSNNQIEYESDDDRNKTLRSKKYINEIKPCL